jgi:ADP-ribosylglycohydrolase
MGFTDRLKGAIYGGAIGDAMGAPVEGRPSEDAVPDFGDHDFSTFIPPEHGGDPEYGKGSGRITDDTLMVEAAIAAYAEAGDHLDACGYAELLRPIITGREVWIPERRKEATLSSRLAPAEQYPLMRLGTCNADPCTAGMGNLVNCGFAMWSAPVGAVNAGDPAAAYREAVLLGSAHNESYALEAGAVMAACVAEALAHDAAPESVLAAATDLSRDGTHAAIVDALDSVDPAADLAEFVPATIRAIAPYNEHRTSLAAQEGRTVSNRGNASRDDSIEELPAALAALKWGEGDFLKTLRGSVCYGRDADSIAGMACALCGGLLGRDALPDGLCRDLDSANRRDFGQLVESFAETVRGIAARDEEHAARRAASMAARRT